MCSTLIIIQAAILSCLAVIGAQSDPADPSHCPLPAGIEQPDCKPTD
jgi:hypothetical protein